MSDQPANNDHPTTEQKLSQLNDAVLVSQFKDFMNRKKYEELIKSYETLILDHPDHKPSKQISGLYEKAKGKLEEALMKSWFESASKNIGKYKNDPGAVQSIDEAIYWVKAFFKRKQYRKAIRGAKEILSIDPGHREIKDLLEQALYLYDKQEHTFKGEFDYEKQKQIEEQEHAWSTLEKLKFEMTNALDLEKYKRAEKLADKVLALEPSDEDALNVKHQLERVKNAKSGSKKQVDLSGMSKLKRSLDIYRLKLEKAKASIIKTIFSRLRESESEKLKRKALELVKEKKEDNVLAQKLQKNIIPQIDKYTLPGFDVWGDTLQSERIGGDSFGFIQRDAENILFYIGDASGHGIQASLFSSRVNLILRECAREGLGLRDTAVRLNQRVFEEKVKEKDKDFMTMILFNWNLKTKTLSFVGAGHEYIIHYKHSEQKIDLIPAKGIAIGMIEKAEPLLTEKQIKIGDQDIIGLFTDGVIEAVMKQNEKELFGINRLNDLLVKNLGAKNSRELYSSIVRSVGEQTVQRDDVTLLVLRRDEHTDLIFEDDLKGIESIDLNTLKNLSRGEVEKSIQEISRENKVKHLLLELNNLLQRGEFQMIVNRCTEAIVKDEVYNKEINNFLRKAKKYQVQQREKERRDQIEAIYRLARDEFKAGESMKAKMSLLKIMKLDEKNLKIKTLFKRVEKAVIKYGPRHLHKKKQNVWLDNLVRKINLALSPANKKDNVDFIVRLSNLVNSGIKVKESLLILIKQAKKDSLKIMYAKMIENLEKGFLLSFSMALYPRVFTSLQTNLVRAGEESGNLGPILDDLSHQLIEERDLKRKIKGALIYPGFIISFSIALVVGMMLGVVPQLAQAYNDAKLTLPVPTQVIIAISNFIRDFWYVLVILGVGGVIGMISFGRTLPGKLFFDQVKIKIPIFKDLTRKSNVFLFGNSLSMLVDSGILLLDAMSITSDVVQNIYYKREIVRVRNDVVNGKALSSALGIDALSDKTKKENEYFPLEVPQMVQVGESTGQITKMLRQVAENYQRELKDFAKNFSTIIEPVLIVFIGVMVGVLLVSIMLPFFEFGKVIKNQ